MNFWWDKILFLSFSFMESLGTIVSLFSQKVKEKVDLIRELSLRHSIEAHGKRPLQTPASFGLKNGVRVERNDVLQTHDWWKEVSKISSHFSKFSSKFSSLGVSFSSIHDRGGAKSWCGQLLPSYRFGLQDASASASISAVVEADVGGFGWRTRRRRTIQNTWRAVQVTYSLTGHAVCSRTSHTVRQHRGATSVVTAQCVVMNVKFVCC